MRREFFCSSGKRSGAGAESRLGFAERGRVCRRKPGRMREPLSTAVEVQFRRVSMTQAPLQLRREFTSSCKRPSPQLDRLLETKLGVSPCSLPALHGAGGGEGTKTPQPRLAPQCHSYPRVLLG